MNNNGDNLKSEIIIYGTEYCKYCHIAKDYLKDKGFNYKYIDVGQDKAQAEIMINKTGQRSIPVIEIGDQILVGFDPDKINKLLNIN